MKTKTRIITVVCTLAFVGVTSAHAANLNKGRSEFNAAIEAVLNDNVEQIIDFGTEAQLVNRLFADREEAKAIKKAFGEKAPAANESEAKAETVAEANEAIDSILDESNVEKIDYRKEAQLVIKLTVDNKEAKVMKELIEEEKLAENK